MNKNFLKIEKKEIFLLSGSGTNQLDLIEHSIELINEN